ncbi:MAG: hypothetical protein J6S04_02285 [Clostridia bacterium]|nr:hypothetical protein [Clostridia bacterium]
MRKTAKKIISLVAVATLFGSTLAMTACGKDFYKEKALPGYTSEGEVKSNGGFAVEKGDYIYYINGKEDYAETNAYGEVTKGALMRIKKSDLTASNYANAEVVVPMMFVAQNYNAGIYIYGDYVYYATPTTDKNMQGEVTNSWIDFKRAKLDGSETMKGYYFRLSNNASNYRFVEENNVVYCLYEEDGMLKSYNTANYGTKKETTTVLVKGASSYFYDNKDVTNGNVYYTMGVTFEADSDTPTTATYNQVYCVNAAATATVNADEASYTVANGKTYDFDQAWMEEQNKKAKDTAKKNGTEYEAVYDFDDYSTYPYVNLGTLVLDGIGKNQETVNPIFNVEHNIEEREEFVGYTYTLTRYENDGIYFTKAGEQADAQLYYLAEDNTAANAVAANAMKKRVAWNTTNASTTALFEVNADGSHTVLYIANETINKVTTTADGVVGEAVPLCSVASGATLWKTEGDMVYYYAAGTHPVTKAATSGYNLSMIDYTGDETLGDKVYENLPNLTANAKYKPTTLTYVDFSSGWYMPEIFGDVLMYANAEAIGDTSYNYIYATSLDLTKVDANNKAYEAAYKAISKDTDNENIQKARTYFYRTGDKALIEELYKDTLYTEDEYNLFLEYTESQKAIDFVGLVGAKDKVIKPDDVDAMEEDWRTALPKEEEVATEEEGLETWAICLIIAGAVIVVAAAVTIPVVILSKKKAAREQAEAIKNAYKRPKIDTTDDKTIDVYADDNAEEAPVEEAPAEVVEETVVEATEEVVETANEEAADASEEAPAEAPAEE